MADGLSTQFLCLRASSSIQKEPRNPGIFSALLSLAYVFMTLAWTLLNAVLVLAFLFACWRVARFLKGHIGAASTMVFMLGLLALSSRSDSGLVGPAKNLLALSENKMPSANRSAIAHQPIDSNIQLIVLSEYQLGEQGVTPRGLYVTFSGVMLGHSWTPQDGLVRVRDNHLQYHVFVKHDWRLLGMPVYVTAEEYTGQLPLKG